jgi:sugar lactone lactonase YvrE
MIFDIECLIESGDILGEGPCWSAAENRLYWFDIKGQKLRWLEPASGASGLVPLGFRASAGAPRAGGLLVATDRGLMAFDSRAESFEPFELLDLGQGFRSNDGQIDGLGRFWWSRMDDADGARPGTIYRTLPGAQTVAALEGIHIPNSLAASPDGLTLYVADSKLGFIHTHAIAADGALGPARPFAQAEAPGSPDGSCVDAEGFLWNAEWGGWRLVRYAPDGRIDRVAPMPVEQPSSCAFGGPGLDTLYVTSAREGLSDEALAGQPQAGGLFAFKPGVRGLPLPAFSG